MNQLLKEIKVFDLIKFIVSAIVFFYSVLMPLDKKIDLNIAQTQANTQAILELKDAIKESNDNNRRTVDELSQNTTALIAYLKGKGIYK